ncbi:MAG: GNAT family N-acetyltransferase [Acidimicrobiales bacterium]|nr:GNAT family N-acetyltransferase [Acidimicrobiales bacterium]
MDDVRLEAIDSSNWREALDVRVRDDQLAFVADHQPVALVILAKSYVRPGGRSWEPLLVRDQAGSVVGVLAIEHGERTCELRNVAIDQDSQGRGLGTAAARAVIEWVRRPGGHCRELAVSAHPDNTAARRAYRAAGFGWSGERRDGEPLMRLLVDRPAE